MVSHRVFIAGERGQVARALARTFSARGDIVLSAGRMTMDIVDEAAVRSTILTFRPDLVINAAAYTAVDTAEDDADQAYKINRDGARHVAASARAVAVPLIHVSSDYVFDGTKPTPYVETDKPNPVGVYGRSKLAGEEAVTAETADYVILRTSWIFSADGTNFVKTILRLAGQRDVIDVIDDQWGAPTFAADLATAIGTIGETLRLTKDRSILTGIYHATASGETTWYRFARAIIELSAARGGPSCGLRPITTNDYPLRARRPANSRLDGSKLQRTFGISLPAWQESLKRCIDEIILAPHGVDT